MKSLLIMNRNYSDVLVVEQGLIMRITIPLATKDSAFTVFRAIAVPMPQPEPDLAIKWKLEAPYLAISENNRETGFLTEYDLGRCIGSSRYQIWLDMIATETGHDSCLATLYFKDSVAALQVCETADSIAGNRKSRKLRLWSLAYNVRYYYCLYFVNQT